jgi:hypothetical protein
METRTSEMDARLQLAELLSSYELLIGQ